MIFIIFQNSNFLLSFVVAYLLSQLSSVSLYCVCIWNNLKIKLKLNETNPIEYSELWKYKKIIHTVFCSSLAGTLITKTRQNIIALKNDFFTEKNLLFDETFTFLFLSLTNRPSNWQRMVRPSALRNSLQQPQQQQDHLLTNWNPRSALANTLV